MFDLRELRRPVVAAPMAGGPSTPELVSAAAAAGGIGFLAAGYKSVDDLMAQVAAVRDLRGSAPFGVNLFVPDGPMDLAAARAYRDRLSHLATQFRVELPEPRDDDDAFDAKCAALLTDPVPVVSFTFGCPTPELLARFREAGTATVVTVTSATEATYADAAGADVLAVQGPEAGGHRSTFDVTTTPGTKNCPSCSPRSAR